MRLTIQTADELGLALRAARRDSRVPLEVLAQTVGVSRQTATNVEQGRTKVSTMLAFLHELGIEVSVEIPQSAFANFVRLQQQAASRASTTSADAAEPDTE
jgi:DNA-binding XRE family transcriptional regulator